MHSSACNVRIPSGRSACARAALRNKRHHIVAGRDHLWDRLRRDVCPPPEKGSLVLLVVVAAAMLAVAAWSSATVFGLIAGRPSRGGELNPWHVPTHGRNTLEIVCALAP